jgi:hypothetical protein
MSGNDLSSNEDLSGADLAGSDLAVKGDLSADASIPFLHLNGGQWELINDVGFNRTWSPMVTLTSLTANAASVSADGTGDDGGNPCTCNAQHTLLPLSTAINCATATLEFDYTTQAGASGFGASNTTSVLFKFVQNAGQAGYLTASEQSGASACAINFATNQFPTPAQLHEGHNSFALASLVSGVDGTCAGIFSFLDISLEAFACSGADTSTATISNVWLY